MDNKTCVTSINGKPFRVTIDRSEMERRYQLSVINEDGSTSDILGPLNWREFEKVHGFEANFPHEIVDSSK